MVLPNVETASLCAEACLALASPALCYAFTWSARHHWCAMADHATFAKVALPFDVRKWTAPEADLGERSNANHNSNADATVGGDDADVYVAGLCRYSAAVPIPVGRQR